MLKKFKTPSNASRRSDAPSAAADDANFEQSYYELRDLHDALTKTYDAEHVNLMKVNIREQILTTEAEKLRKSVRDAQLDNERLEKTIEKLNFRIKELEGVVKLKDSIIARSKSAGGARVAVVEPPRAELKEMEVGMVRDESKVIEEGEVKEGEGAASIAKKYNENKIAAGEEAKKMQNFKNKEMDAKAITDARMARAQSAKKPAVKPQTNRAQTQPPEKQAPAAAKKPAPPTAAKKQSPAAAAAAAAAAAE